MMDVAIGLCTTPAGKRVAVLADERVRMLDDVLGRQTPTTLVSFIEEGRDGLDRVANALQKTSAASWSVSEGKARVETQAPVHLRAPISATTKIICLGDIFLSHLAVRGSPVPDRVGIFFKQNQDVIGPWEPIVIPRPHRDGVIVAGTEMALVVGREGRYIPADAAWDHIWGFSVFNDVTLRGLHAQLGETPKVFETSAPVGPFLWPRAHVADPAALGLRMRINGQQVQDGNTSDMRFSLAEAIAEISNWHTLRPGDIIATGDIGSADGLHDGDVVECEVEGIGTLVNPVRQD